MVIYGAYIRFWPTLHICFCLHLPCRCSTLMCYHITGAAVALLFFLFPNHICFCLHLPCRCSTSMVLDCALAETIVVSSPRSLACVATIPGCPGAVSASLRHLYCVNQRARLHRSSVSIVAQLEMDKLKSTFAPEQYQHRCATCAA